MKIKSISWRNYKGLEDGSITAEGQNVLISGRNGVGKSSIAEILPFVLFGKVAGSLNRYDESGLTIRDGQIHGAQIIFDDGTTLRRELVDAQNGGSTTNYFINGAPVQKRKYDAKVESMTSGAGELSLNPFAFFNQTSKARRDFIARTFGALSEREFLSTPENAEIVKMFDGMTAESFISYAKNELRRLKTSASEIPPKIEELQRQISEVPNDLADTLKKIVEQISAKRSELAEVQKSTAGNARIEYESATRRKSELERQKNFTLRQLNRERERREKLLAEFRRLRASSVGNCPTCGQKIPLEMFEAKRDEKLLEIVSEGTKVKEQIGELESELATTDAELEKNLQTIEQLELKVQSETCAEKTREERLGKLNGEISELESEKLRLQTASAVEKRIGQLAKSERELNQQIATLEGQLEQAEKFQHEKIRHFETQINGQFEHVRFKLFDRLIDGTLRDTCEVMLDGVPYSALSKGEKLKAALDIFKALQKHYGVEMPLIIDDAESYTQNSFVELPNQKFFFRVTDTELAIVVGERRQAA